MKARQKTVYVALRTLSHRMTGDLIEPGTVADLSHCTPDELEMLVALDAVERRQVLDDAQGESDE